LGPKAVLYTASLIKHYYSLTQSGPPGIIIPFRTITVDGISSDWSGINPIVTDAQGDSICETGTDIRRYYLAKDNTYLYWRVDTWSGTFSFGSPGNEKILVLLFLEIGTPSQGPYPNGITVNSILQRTLMSLHAMTIMSGLVYMVDRVMAW